MNRVIELIGNTPLVELSSKKRGVRLLGKMESLEPGGSVKDRPVRSMVLRAEERGDLTPGMRLVEPTSGNTGIALAMVGAARGYRVELVMPETATEERVQLMRSYGAEVILTAADRGIEGSIDRAREMAASDDYFMLDQFANPDNPRAHYETTGPEIFQDTDGQVTHFVSAMGTTGTIMGVSRYLKEQRPEIQIVGVQPTDGSCIPGIRRWPKEYLPKIFEPERVDRIVDVDQKEAERTARALAIEEGLLVGVSAAGAALVARRICDEIDEGVVVFILCDRGDRYMSTPIFGGSAPA